MIRHWLRRHRETIFHWSMEVVIVVIGILIAFALQGWAEDRASARRAVDAERRIRGELLGNAEHFVERIAIHPCLRANAEGLMEGLTSGDATWHPRTFAPGRSQVSRIVYPVPIRSSGGDVYRGALANDDLARATPERRAALANLYRSSDRLDTLNNEENELADRLQLLQFNVKLSAPERNAMLLAVARLDSINGLIRLISSQFLGQLRKDGVRLSLGRRVDGFSSEDWTRDLAYARARYGSCVDARAIGVMLPSAARR